MRSAMIQIAKPQIDETDRDELVPLPHEEFLRERKRQFLEQTGESTAIVRDREGNKVDLLEWNTCQADLIIDWLRILYEETACGRSDHRYVADVLANAPKRDARRAKEHLYSHLSPEQKHDVDNAFLAAAQRVGTHMSTLCKYSGVDVDTALSTLRRHYEHFRQDIRRVTYHWNIKAGENSTPASEVNEHFHEPIDAVALDDRFQMALLFMDARPPYVAEDETGPHVVDAPDDQPGAHRQELIVAPRSSLWLPRKKEKSVLTS